MRFVDGVGYIDIHDEKHRGCTDCVLDNIRAEIEQTADEEQEHDKKWAIGLRHAVKIIDKYR